MKCKQLKKISPGAAPHQSHTVPRTAPPLLPPLPSAVDGSGMGPALELQMQQRIRDQFAARQRPAAEAEARRLAAPLANLHSPEEARRQLGFQMGADFSNVRFHTGDDAARRAERIGADAFTSGLDVYFGTDGYTAETAAHELVHTVQQGAVSSPMVTQSAPLGQVQMSPPNLSTLYQDAIAGNRKHMEKWIPAIGNTALWNFSSQINPIFDNYFGQSHDNQSPETHTAQILNLMDTHHLTSMKYLTDPMFRQAISNYTNGNSSAGNNSIDDIKNALLDKINHRVMAATMYMPTISPAPQPDGSMITRKDIEQATQAGRNMAHIMLNLQLGDIQITEPGGQTHPFGYVNNNTPMSYRPSVCSLLSYGGRVQFNFSGSSNASGVTGNDIYRSMMELDRTVSNDALTDSQNMLDRARQTKITRFAATHWIDQNREEQKSKSAAWSAFFSSFKQRGFNPAIGGIGNEGIVSSDNYLTPGPNGQMAQGHIINSDGRNGHMYMGIDPNSPGSMLVGLETSAPLQENLLGRTHDASGGSSEYSAIGAPKSDLPGQDVNGRIVTFPNISNERLQEYHNILTRKLDLLSSRPTEYNRLMDQLSERKLTLSELNALLGMRS